MNFNLTDIEEKFLKQYAEVFESERDCDWTADPIVLVQDRKKYYTNSDSYDDVEYALEINGRNLSDYNLISDIDLVKDEIREYLDGCAVDKEVIQELIDDMELELNGYFSYDKWEYDMNNINVMITKYYSKYYYETVAYFFTRKEAEKYIKYQGHNLADPRVFTSYAGYSNLGDYPIFQKMLLRMGKELLENE